jgi:hypothetical protein
MLGLCERFCVYGGIFWTGNKRGFVPAAELCFIFFICSRKKVDPTFNYKVFAVKTFKRIEYLIHAVIWFCCPFKFPIGCSSPYRRINLCWQRAKTFHFKIYVYEKAIIEKEIRGEYAINQSQCSRY